MLSVLIGIVHRSCSADEISGGVALSGIDGLRQSWTCAVDTLRVGEARQLATDRGCYSYYDNRLAVLLSGLPENWQSAEFLVPLRRLLATERDAPVLLHTLNVWYQEGASSTRAAKALGIHRNTFDHRLKKINEATALDLSAVDDFVMMYIALQRSTK